MEQKSVSNIENGSSKDENFFLYTTNVKRQYDKY